MSRKDISASASLPSSGGLNRSTVPISHTNFIGCCPSARPGPFPGLELLKQGVLLLLSHRCAANGLPAFVDEARKHCSQHLRARPLYDLHVALQPLIGRTIAAPTGQLRAEVDLIPFRAMSWCL